MRTTAKYKEKVIKCIRKCIAYDIILFWTTKCIKFMKCIRLITNADRGIQ